MGKKLKILLCGEGRHDIGSGGYAPQEGWLQVLVRRLVGKAPHFAVRHRRDLISLPSEKPARPAPKGHGEKAYFAMRTAALENHDIVVFMVDADSPDAKRWREIRQEIAEGFKRAGKPICGVACIPMSASESWMLADETAWRKLGLKNAALLPGKPEEIWGVRNDPQGNHPHQFFTRVCVSAQVEENTRTRHDLMAHMSLDTLAAKCKTSFPPFRDELQTCTEGRGP